MFFIEMLAAFLVLGGLVILVRSLLRVNSGEGMFLSVALIVLLFWLSSRMGSFIYGFYCILGLALLGGIVGVASLLKREHSREDRLFSPVFVLLAGLYVFALITLYHDFIQHIDEFHHWAAAVKYLLERDAMPTGYDFLGGGGNYAFATSLFHLFFQKFTGYNEQGMYVSAFLLMWVGFLLPFSEYGWKDWKKIAVYVVIIYISLFSLYMYGSKSLYVDVPTAAWAGGLAGWWVNRKKKSSNALIAAVGFVMLHFFKASAGLLMAVLVGFFMMVHTCLIEKGCAEEEDGRKKIVIGSVVACLLVLLCSAMLLGAALCLKPAKSEAVNETAVSEVSGESEGENLPPAGWSIAGVRLPDFVSDQINIVKLSKDKIIRTLGAFFTKSIGAGMSTRSNLSLSFATFVIFLLWLLKFSGTINGQKNRAFVYVLYGVVATLCYSAAVFFSYLFMFAYELSIDLRSCTRYFSIWAIFLFIVVLTELMQRGADRKNRMCDYVLAGVLAFFLLGLNEEFIPNTTALDKTNTSGYEKIMGTVEEIHQLEDILTETDKVYYLCQYPADNLGGAELYNASALYYLDGRISNYLQTPWKFTSTGSNLRLEEFDTSINELPSLLAQGGYTYLWVHTTNPYLTRELPLVLSCDEVADGYLYKVVYENGVATGLEFVKALAG